MVSSPYMQHRGLAMMEPMEVPDDKALNKICKHIRKATAAAVKEIMPLELEKDEEDIIKRIVKYMWKALDVELLNIPWDAATVEIVNKVMHPLSSALGDSPWFCKINLVPAFTNAAWYLCGYGPYGTQLKWEGVEAVVTQVYSEIINKQRLDKVLWKAAAEMYGEENKATSKVYRALSAAHARALEEVMDDIQRAPPRRPNPRQEEERVEEFVQKWIHDSSYRCSGALEAAGTPLTEESLVAVFQQLISPPEEEDEASDAFSCIPSELTEHIPPPDWPFLQETVADVFAEMRGEKPAAPKKKKRKTGGGGGGDYSEMPYDVYAAPPPSPMQYGMKGGKGKGFEKGYGNGFDKGFDKGAGKAAKGGAIKAAGGKASGKRGGKAAAPVAGHPECTSKEDCIGSYDSLKVRHVLDGQLADLYCEACWNSFLEASPDLEGQYED